MVVALAFMPGRVLRGTSAAELRLAYPKADLLLESPEELSMAAAVRSGGLIFRLIKQFSPEIADNLALGNKLFNNSRAWYKELSLVALNSQRLEKKVRPKNITSGERQMTQNIEHSSPTHETAKEPTQPGSSFRYKDVASKFIHLTTKENPKRPNTDAHKIFELYFTNSPMTVEAYMKLGARLRDIKCDIERGYATLKDTA